MRIWILALILIVPIESRAGIISSFDDFSSLQGHLGWSYGYFNGAGGVTDYDPLGFIEMSVYDPSAVDDLGEEAWTVFGWPSNALSASGSYTENDNQYVVRRFTASDNINLMFDYNAENIPVSGGTSVFGIHSGLGFLLSPVFLAENESTFGTRAG